MKRFIVVLNIFIFFFHLDGHASYFCSVDNINENIYLQNDSTQSDSVKNLSEEDRTELNKFTYFLTEKKPSHFYSCTGNLIAEKIVSHLNTHHKISLNEADELLKSSVKDWLWKGVRGTVLLSTLTLWTYGAFVLTPEVPIYTQPVILPISLITAISLLNSYSGARLDQFYQLISNIGKSKKAISHSSLSLNTLAASTGASYSAAQVNARTTLTSACNSLELQLNGLNADLQMLPYAEKQPYLKKRLSEIILRFQECFKDVNPFGIAIREPMKTRLSIYKEFVTSNSIDEILELIPAEYRTEDQLNSYRELLTAWIPAAQTLLENVDPAAVESIVIHTE